MIMKVIHMPRCYECEHSTHCPYHDGDTMTVSHLFDIGVDNVHMVQVDSFEAAALQKDRIRHGQFATEKQLNFLKSLFAERTGNEEAMILRRHLLEEYKAGKLSVSMASEAIEDVKALPRDTQTLPAAPTYEHGEVWMTNDNRFVKIQLNQAGTSFYGKVWNQEDQEWEYAGKGILYILDHIVTADEAKEFSLQWDEEHRYCVFCMKHLSDPRSEFAGYGETCAENQGLPWGETA